MSDEKLPARRGEFSEELVRQIAFDVGKQLVEQIESVHPEMTQAVMSWESTRLSLRNTAHNAIMEAVKAANEGRIEEMLSRHDKHRRTMRKLRKAKTLREVADAMRI